MMRPNSSATHGFTLLEVLVSTILLGTVFVAVVGLTSQSLRNIDRMQPQERALLHAREKMNESLLLEELTPTTRSGHWDDGYQWQLEISSSERDSELKHPTHGLFRIRVVIGWEGEGKIKTYAVQTTQWARRVTQNANK
jgi:prepilin-type N-terminal cleavage/methylation domain-containing protein